MNQFMPYMQDLKLNPICKKFITNQFQGMISVPYFFRATVYCYYFQMKLP